MPNLKEFIIIGIFAIFATNLSGQNYLMKDSISAFHGSARLSTSSFEDIVGVQIGYTLKGRLTTGVDFGRGNDKINKMRSTIVRPNLNYFLIKQNHENFPISINLETAYQINILPTTSYNTRAVQFGIGIFHAMIPAENIKLIPHVGLIMNKITKGSGGQENEGLTMIYNLGLHLLWEDRIFIAPSYARNNGLSVLSIKVGSMFL